VFNVTKASISEKCRSFELYNVLLIIRSSY